MDFRERSQRSQHGGNRPVDDESIRRLSLDNVEGDDEQDDRGDASNHKCERPLFAFVLKINKSPRFVTHVTIAVTGTHLCA